LRFEKRRLQVESVTLRLIRFPLNTVALLIDSYMTVHSELGDTKKKEAGMGRIEGEGVNVSAKAWHAVDAEAVFGKTGTSPKGLSQAEAAERLKKFGLNRLTPQRKRGQT